MVHLQFINLVKSVSDLGPPGFLGIRGERLFFFSELGSTGNYFQVFGEQVHSFGELGIPAKKLKKSHLKRKAFILLIFSKNFFGRPGPPWISKCIYFPANMLTWIVLITDMANYFYYRGKFDLKLLIFRLIITYFGTLRMRHNAPV